jgi:hypothetical protein
MSGDWGYGVRSPHEYAADIARMPTREERRAALDAVPEIVRPIVRDHVEHVLGLAWRWQRRAERGERVPARMQALIAWLRKK